MTPDPRAVPEAGLVVGVVVHTAQTAVLAGEEVVARDIVRIAVAVLVLTIREHSDQITGIETWVWLPTTSDTRPSR